MNTDKLLDKIIRRQTDLYDTVYFYGDSTAAAQTVDKLLARYTARKPKANILRTDAEAFRRQTLEMLQSGDTAMPDCDLYIFERLEKIAGLETNERRLYGILDHLLENRRQIVICGAAPTAQMENLAPRIRAQVDGAIALHLG